MTAHRSINSKLILIFLGLLIAGSRAQNIEYVSSTLYSGSFYSLVTSGDYAYMTSSGYLFTMDISDLSNPELIGSRLPMSATEAFRRDNLIFFACGYGGVRIVDITEPVNPVIITQFNSDAYADEVCSDGNYAYVAQSQEGILIADVSDPSDPFAVSRYPIWSGAAAVEIRGDYLYVAASDTGLVIFNVSDPYHISVTSWYNNHSLGEHVFCDISLDGDYAYIADAQAGLRIFNIANPASPVYCSTLAPAHGITKVIVRGNYAYLGYYWGNFYVADISNPLQPRQLGTYSGLEYTNTICLKDSVLLAGGRITSANYQAYGSIQFIDITNPDTLTLRGRYDNFPSSTGSIAIQGNYTYTAGGAFYITDISNPLSPTPIGHFDSLSYSGELIVSGDYAYIVDGGDGLQILQIDNPSDPLFAGNYNIDWYTYSVGVRERYAYLTAGSRGIYIIDCSDPAHPELASHYQNSTQYIMELKVSGNYAYYLDDYNLNIADISNPDTLIQVGSWRNTSGMSNLFVDGDYAYLSCNARFTIIDVSDPLNPFFVGSLNSPHSPGHIFVQGNYAYFNASDFGICVIDITDRTAPRFIDNYLDISAVGITARGNNIYVAANGSLTLLQFPVTSISEPDNFLPREIGGPVCYPNPFNAQTTIEYSLSQPASVTIEIYDILGRKIAMLLQGEQQAGIHSVIWNASSQSSGIYFYRIKAGDRVELNAMTLIK